MSPALVPLRVVRYPLGRASLAQVAAGQRPAHQERPRLDPLPDRVGGVRVQILVPTDPRPIVVAASLLMLGLPVSSVTDRLLGRGTTPPDPEPTPPPGEEARR